MKRIILLLLLFASFRFSYGQELTAEQQQLAWNYIYHNMLSDDFQPSTFKQDIAINLKGGITSEDSLFTTELIKSFQKAIPHLKIELSKNQGNLILGLNYGKRNTVNINMNGDHELQSVGMYFPISENLSKHERNQFIYSQLFRGLTFFSQRKLTRPFPELKGCVFEAENISNSCTFSPYDLFILEKLYSPDFSIQLSKNLSPELQRKAWEAICTDDNNHGSGPIIFENEIAIEAKGIVNPIDSVCMNELVSQLQIVIPNRKIYLTKEKANLIFSFTDSLDNIGTIDTENGKIRYIKRGVNFPPGKSKEIRKKTLYKYLLHSIVFFNPSPDCRIDGCVFYERETKNITYHPIDAFILNKLYADDFNEQFKTNWIANSSLRSYYTFKYFIQLETAGKITGILLAIFLLSILIRKGVFKYHNWKLNRFTLQIIWAAVIYDVYHISSLVIKNLDFQIYLYKSNFIHSFVFFHLALFFVPLLFFFIERKINSVNLAVRNKLQLLTANSAVLSFLLSFAYFHVYMRNDLDVRLMFSIGISIAFASIRLLLFTFSELKKNELRAKDNELALLKEKNKQAELESLRAKINPHFLYNALNSIASLATTDARKTEQMALALSDFFKYAINREQKQLNSLSEELNAIRTYLEIEKVRFGDRLSFEINCPEELQNIQIPQLLIQPLVENAIKHGLSQITENGKIGISVFKENSFLKIRISDNGPAFPEGPLSGFGIRNTQERISLIYGEKASVNWQNGKEKFIELCLPVGI